MSVWNPPFDTAFLTQKGHQQGASPSIRYILSKSVRDITVHHVTYKDQPDTDSAHRVLVFQTAQEPGQRSILSEARCGLKKSLRKA